MFKKEPCTAAWGFNAVSQITYGINWGRRETFSYISIFTLLQRIPLLFFMVPLIYPQSRGPSWSSSLFVSNPKPCLPVLVWNYFICNSRHCWSHLLKKWFNIESSIKTSLKWLHSMYINSCFHIFVLNRFMTLFPFQAHSLWSTMFRPWYVRGPIQSIRDSSVE